MTAEYRVISQERLCRAESSAVDYLVTGYSTTAPSDGGVINQKHLSRAESSAVDDSPTEYSTAERNVYPDVLRES